jgi:hypothetical protein
VPLVKRVTAVGDDEVCRSKEPVNTIAINGKVVAEVFDKDEGRQLPTWNGCMRLIDGEILPVAAASLFVRLKVFRTGLAVRCSGRRASAVDLESGLITRVETIEESGGR